MRREVQFSSANLWPGLGRPFADDVCLPFLRATQNFDGGWGFTPRAPSSIEPTCWSLLALARPVLSRDDRTQPLLHLGIAWLERAQLRDGSWPSHPGSSQGCWLTAWACLVLHTQDHAPDAVARGAHWLCRAMPAEAGFLRRLRLRFSLPVGTAPRDATFGWSCHAGGDSGIEPTAVSLLVLQNLPPHQRPYDAARRMDYAQAMLRERLCRAASADVNSSASDPAHGIYSTAWTLLALRNESERAENQDRLNWLQRAAVASRGPASVALAQIALRVCGRRTDSLDGRLARLHSSNQFLNQIPVVAAASIAVNPLPPWLARQSQPAAAHGPLLLQRV